MPATVSLVGVGVRAVICECEEQHISHSTCLEASPPEMKEPLVTALEMVRWREDPSFIFSLQH